MIATILSYFTAAALSAVAGKLWKGFCELINTPVGAAVVAGVLMFGVGTAHEYRKVNAAWQLKWDQGVAEARAQVVKRDALVKAQIQAEADQKIAALTERKDELERQVKAYEDDQTKQAAANKGPCAPELTDDGDARWLHDNQRKRTSPKPHAQRGFALRLRALDSGRSSAGDHGQAGQASDAARSAP